MIRDSQGSIWSIDAPESVKAKVAKVIEFSWAFREAKPSYSRMRCEDHMKMVVAEQLAEFVEISEHDRLDEDTTELVGRFSLPYAAEHVYKKELIDLRQIIAKKNRTIKEFREKSFWQRLKFLIWPK